MEYNILLDVHNKWRVVERPEGQIAWKAISPPYSKYSFALQWAVKHNINRDNILNSSLY